MWCVQCVLCVVCRVWCVQCVVCVVCVVRGTLYLSPAFPTLQKVVFLKVAAANAWGYSAVSLGPSEFSMRTSKPCTEFQR